MRRIRGAPRGGSAGIQGGLATPEEDRIMGDVYFPPRRPPAGGSAPSESQRTKPMNPVRNHDGRIPKIKFASVYPHYLAKVEKKGRTKEELHQVITWLTGFDEKKLQKLIKDEATFEEFFQQADLNPNAHLITGVICGYRVEEIENPLTRQARYMDKLVDELAKGRKMEKILREA